AAGGHRGGRRHRDAVAEGARVQLHQPVGSGVSLSHVPRPTSHAPESIARLRAEVSRRIIGQDRVIDEILMALMAGGHALLVGVPGLAKTLIIHSIADAMRLAFRRIQFTPDLVPSDITGTEIMEEDPGSGARTFRFV